MRFKTQGYTLYYYIGSGRYRGSIVSTQVYSPHHDNEVKHHQKIYKVNKREDILSRDFTNFTTLTPLRENRKHHKKHESNF